jgi:peptide/nickel transport system permease protein
MVKFLAFFRNAPFFPLAVLAAFVFLGVFGEWIAPHDPVEGSLMDSLTPPFWEAGGKWKYPLGTDSLGRDILSRIMGGAGISLQIGILVVFVAGLMGTLLACLAGYLGGAVDTVIMRVVDLVMSIPYLVLAIVLAAILGASVYNIIIILGAVIWTYYCRVLRSEVLRLRESDFVRLAVVGGCSKGKIMLVHIFPNIVNTLVVIATLNLGTVIIAESSLSFLGLGVPPPSPAWGSMVADGRDYVGQAWWVSFWPGLAIFLVVMSFNLVGDWLRVRLDPKFRQMAGGS